MCEFDETTKKPKGDRLAAWAEKIMSRIENRMFIVWVNKVLRERYADTETPIQVLIDRATFEDGCSVETDVRDNPADSMFPVKYYMFQDREGVTFAGMKVLRETLLDEMVKLPEAMVKGMAHSKGRRQPKQKRLTK